MTGILAMVQHPLARHFLHRQNPEKEAAVIASAARQSMTADSGSWAAALRSQRRKNARSRGLAARAKLKIQKS